MPESRSFPFEELQDRIGKAHLARRLGLQADHSSRYFGQGFGRFHWENLNLLPLVLGFLLKVSGLLGAGEAQCLGL